MHANGVSVSAISSPTASDNAPAMNGPERRPNRFWNSDRIDAPVERTPGWITSMTIAAAGPTVQVARKPAEQDQHELAALRSVMPNCFAPKANIRTSSSSGS